MTQSRARVAVGLALAAILSLSLLLRVWGAGFGLPAYTRYHPDEHALVERAAAILWTGDWNLHRFNYPPFYAYVQAGVYAGHFLWGAAQGEWDQVPSFALPGYYLWGRLATAVVGTLTVLVIYLVGRQLRGRRTGVLAAALLGGGYLHVIHSHYATFDVMVGFLAALTLLFSDLLRTRRDAKWYFLAGLAAGLAGATKYNGALVLVVPLAAHLLATPWGEWGWLSARFFLIPLGFLLGFFGGNPFALGNVTEFLNGLATVLHHYGTQQPGFEGTANWRWYVRIFLTSADALWVAVGSLGLLILVWRDWRKGLLLLVFPALYFLTVSSFIVRFERNMVPLLPFLAIGAAWLVDAGSEWVAWRLGRSQAWSHAVAAGSLFLLLALPVAADISFDTAISRQDTRELAGQWVEDNVAKGSKIAIEHYAIPFDYDAYTVEDVIRITEHDQAWYQEQEFDILIVSDGVWALLRRLPSVYGERLAALDQLASENELVKEFVPHAPGIVTAGYPSVGVYHFAPVRIYRVNR